ncbi:hypothetical protein [Fusibacter sp. JL216-2]
MNGIARTESQSSMNNKASEEKDDIVRHITEQFPALNPVTLFARVFLM